MIAGKHALALVIILGLVGAGVAHAVNGGKFDETQDGVDVTGPYNEALQPFDKDSLSAIVESRKAKPFLMAFWSVGCGICIVEMQVWREVRDKHPDFDLVLVSTDPIKNEPFITHILEREGMHGFESWAFADPIKARVRSSVDIKWRGELPRIHLYGPDGKASVHMGKITTPEVLSWWEAQKG